VTFDLTGLPPTPEEIKNFLEDNSPEAYEKLVNRLIDKPQYGEHMTKYWLDLVRFADTNGVHHDHYREMSPYRSWVIKSFNDNLPYDDFVKYQLAGDLYEKPTQEQLVASGFNRLHLIIDVGTALPEESYTKNVIDRVTAVGTAFLGLTVQCAVCHDHKYDPISSKDFYGLFAFFNNIDAKPETGHRNGFDFERGLQPPYIFLSGEAEQKELSKVIGEMGKLNKEKKDLVQKQKSTKDANEKMKLSDSIKALDGQLQKLKEKSDSLEKVIRPAMVMKERKEVRPAYILIRGEYDKFGEEVQRATPSFLPPMKSDKPLKTRMDLAEWFVAPENPLTARVAVNRFWQQFFGVGLVKTSEDLGAQGEVPSHPLLLDYLTKYFTDKNWNVKELVKLIVSSKTYRQSSNASEQQFKVDSENRLLSRGSRFRMDSEMIRDQILATSGLLNSEMYGNSVKPPQPDGLWNSVTMPSSYPRYFVADSGNKIYRRSLYTFWKRGMPPPQMTIFNAPSREECITRRERTNTPLQALLLLNEKEYLKAARNLAKKAMEQSALSDDAKLVFIYETVTSKLPDASEMDIFKALLKDLSTEYSAKPKLTEQLCEGVKLEGFDQKVKLAAWTVLTSSIYNLDICKTRE
jgi:hypothetical protein